jgi:hypothetical protein
MSAMGKGDIVIAKTHVRSKAQKRTSTAGAAMTVKGP